MNSQPANSPGVKQRIIAATLSLMETKPFPEITVTEIVGAAGVARQSYYRNFTSREAIIQSFFKELHDEVLTFAEEQPVVYPSRHAIALIFAAIKKRRRELLTLHRSGFAQYALETINEMVEFFLGDMPANSIERYHLSMFSGAVYNTAVTWLAQGAKERCEDMAQMICAFRADLLPHCVISPEP